MTEERRPPRVSARLRTELECSQCGVFLLSTHPLNEHETKQAVKDHAIKRHGGESLW
jgi:hypothetical protein